MIKSIIHTLVIPYELAGLRLDLALAKLLPEYSRTQAQTWIKNGELLLDGAQPKAKYMVMGGEHITINAALKVQPDYQAQAIALDIIYEDEALLVINKPMGLVVHPGAGNSNNTLLNALLHHAPQLKALPRAGIIHRLDKNTTGLLVVAKTSQAILSLTRQLKARSISRIYQAIVSGIIISGGMIETYLGRHPLQRKRMAVFKEEDEVGKLAITHYRVMERYRAHTRLKVQLETGRTHQIRVHMTHIHHPIIGDPVYGGRLQLPKGATPELVAALRLFKRQALHACELSLTHPVSGEQLTWQAPLPADLQELITTLRDDNKHQE